MRQPGMQRTGDTSGRGRRFGRWAAALAALAVWLLAPALASAQLVGATKSVSGTLAPGSTVTYTIIGFNALGTTQGDNAGDEFVDVLPVQLQLVSASATSGTAVANIGTNTVTWNGSVPPAGSVTVTITATIVGAAGSTVTNQGTVNYDLTNDGVNDSQSLTDDPSTVAPFDPTSFVVVTPLAIQPTSLTAIVVGTPVVQAISATGGTGGPYSFSVVAGALPAGLAMDAAGQITGSPTAAGDASFTVSASDGVNPAATRAYTWTVLPAVVVTPATLPTLVVDTPASIPLTAAGGDGGPYTFAVSAGTLPAGLSLNATTGVLSGTPATAGPYAFTVQATDASAHTGTRSYSGAVSPAERTYFLAEGATGSFFDEDLSIANPNSTAAPITVTFLPENAAPIVQTHTLPAQSRLTIRVDDVAGLAAASTSAQVASTSGLPLAVERTMFWDARAYGGHTETAVQAASTRWLFAEGAQGFFETFVLIANPQTSPADVTLTFLREDGVNVTSQVQVPAQSRRTVAANGIAGLANRAFGIVVDSTQPVVAERAMYFGSTASRPLAGGHGAVGVTAPSTTWLHAEAATGVFFDSFILLANPQAVAANVTVRYLLPSGVAIDVPKVVPARGRLTVNIDSEADARLHNASVGVVVTSDQPIVSERSMYWTTGEGAVPWGEAHNSFGATAAAPRWAVAEGRAGGPSDFRTYLLLSNAGSGAAQVTVTYLPETGAAIARTYQLPATSRVTVDVASDVPQLAGQRFGAAIATAGDVPIVVERSMYWNGDGLFWSGGTNALGTPLP
jgi:uncharacterized repeat protein (TIGR01451 family)